MGSEGCPVEVLEHIESADDEVLRLLHGQTLLARRALYYGRRQRQMMMHSDGLVRRSAHVPRLNKSANSCVIITSGKYREATRSRRSRV